MEERDKFFAVLENHRLQFGLTHHIHEDHRGTMIEVFSEGKRVVYENRETRDSAYYLATQDLIEWTGWQLAKIEEFLERRKAI